MKNKMKMWKNQLWNLSKMFLWMTLLQLKILEKNQSFFMIKIRSLEYSSYETELRKTTSHFHLLTRKFS